MQIKYLKVVILVLCHSIARAQLGIIEEPVTGNEWRNHAEFNPNNFFVQGQQDALDLSTGSIYQTINLLTLKGRAIEVPVSIVYNGRGSSVNDIPGLIGLGWDLKIGGWIKREVRHIPDESRVFKALPGPEVYNLPFDQARHLLATDYYNMPINGQTLYNGWIDYAVWKFGSYPWSVPDQNVSAGAQVASHIQDILNQSYPDPNTNAANYLHFLGETVGLGVYASNIITHDTQPDIFHFNLNGLTGTFVFDAEGFPKTIPKLDIDIQPGIGIRGENSWIFTLVDGTKFIFENSSEFTEKIEVISDNNPVQDNWKGNTPDYNEGKHIESYTATWFLSKIQSRNGDEILFRYENDPDFSYENKNHVRLDYHKSTDGFSQTSASYIGESKEYERTDAIKITEKKILKEVTSSQGKIFLEYDNIRNDIATGMSKLNKIKMVDVNEQEVRSYEFDYDYFTSGSSCSNSLEGRRLKLESVKNITNNDLSTPPIHFIYNESVNLPCRGSAQQDFWGYYNNNTHTNLVPSVTAYVGFVGKSLAGANRNPDLTRSQANILTEIVWPTQGRTEYFYELNSCFDGSVNDDLGGLRISKVIEYTDESKTNGVATKYHYNDLVHVGRSSGTVPVIVNLGNLPPSLGKQYEIQRIFWNIDDINRSSDEYKFYVFRTSNSKYNLYLNEPVRYSWVHIEQQDLAGNGNGKTSYALTDFNTNPDLTNLKYYADFDGISLSSGSRMTPVPAAPNISRSYERGKTTKIIVTDKFGNKVKETNFNYNFNSNTTPANIYGYSSDSDDKFFYWGESVWSYNVEIYNEQPRSCVLEGVNENYYTASGEMQSTKTFEYHPVYNSLKTSESELLYDGTQKITNYSYAIDLVGPIYDAIRQKHLIDLTAVAESINKGAVEKKIYFYNEQPNGIILTEKIQMNTASGFSIEDRLKFNVYDNFGNILEWQESNNYPVVYLWGYKNTHPVAEIRNATYQEVLAVLGQSIIDELNDNPGTDEELRQKLQSLRTSLPKAQVTISTYRPLVGITSETDMNGRTTFYEYDGSNRLNLVKDQDNNILKQYTYHYKEQ